MVKILVNIFLISLTYQQLIGQTNIVVNDKIETHINSTYKVENPIRRKTLETNGNYNPLIFLASGLLFIYQNIFSEQISAECTYETTCSEYTKKCISKYGFIKGSIKGLHQLSCCSSTVIKDLPEYLINKEGEIINEMD